MKRREINRLAMPIDSGAELRPDHLSHTSKNGSRHPRNSRKSIDGPMSIRGHRLLSLFASATSCFCAMLGTAAPTSGQETSKKLEPPNPHALISSYLEFLPRIEEFYTWSNVRATLTNEQRIGEPNYKKTTTKLEVIRARPAYLQSIETFNAPAEPAKEGQILAKERVSTINPEYGFMLEQKVGGESLTLGNFSTAGQTGPIEQSIVMKARFTEGLYRFTATMSFREYLTSKLGEPQSVTATPFERDGKPLVKIEFRHADAKPVRAGMLQPVSLTVSPSEGWALYEAVTSFLGTTDPVINTFTVEYSGSKNGFLLPRRIIDQRGPKTRFVMDIESISFDQPPKDRFYLSYFGLPEPGDPNSSRPWPPTYAWIYSLAFFFLLTAFAAWHLGWRRSRGA